MDENTPWQPKDVAAAKALYEAGDLSCAQIGLRFHRTRNAIIGLAHRRKWDRGGHGRRYEAQKAASAKSSGAAAHKARRDARQPKKPAPPAAPLSDPAPQLVPVVSAPADAPRLDQLKAGACRWPIGEFDGEHRFCAAPRAGEGPYCSHHAARAIGKATDRRALERDLRRFA